MSTLTPQQKAANTRKRKAFMKKIAENQEMFRNNPKELAAEIARNIRADKHRQEHPNKYENGQMHWRQSEWGMTKFSENLVKSGAIKEVQIPGSSRVHLEVSCPTTGCVAGWATTLAGMPMVYQSTLKGVRQTLEWGDDGVLETSHCKSLDGQNVEYLPDVAQELLGIGREERGWLFDGDRKVDEVLWALDNIAKTGTFDPDLWYFEKGEDRW